MTEDQRHIESIEIRKLESREASVLNAVADEVFDDKVVFRRSREFLADPRHHLVVALHRDQVIGFASAVHYVHPDKPQPEMWINELGVAPTFRRRGIATLIIQRVEEIARQLECSGVWVVTEPSNQAAMELYQSIPRAKSQDTVVFTFPIFE